MRELYQGELFFMHACMHGLGISYCMNSYTVDLEIFVVKIFSWFAQTTKIKKEVAREPLMEIKF